MAVPGALIADRYRLIRQLGAGGMGVVWEARDERLGRLVAVKQLRSQPGLSEAETEVSAQRAMREARINARLHHPYAITVFDVVEHDGNPCIVMELVPSMPLTEATRQLGALTPSEAARIGAQIAAALAAAHALGIVHRDVKPGNVLIGDDGTARICDFGISRTFGDATLTMTGMITGTPAYIAPETARGEESTFASDVYSLGATLYAAVEGQPPFGNDGNAIAVLYRVAAGQLRPPEQAGTLGPLLVEMLSADPQQRPSMTQAAARLSALAGGAAAPTTARLETADATPPPPAPGPTASFPTSAPTVQLRPGTTVQRPAVAAQARPAAAAPRAPAAPTGPKNRRGVYAALIAAIVIVVAAVAAIALLLPNTQPPTIAGPSPSQSSRSAESASAEPTSADPTSASPSSVEPTSAAPTPVQPSSTAPPSTPSGSATTATPAELTRAVADYYALLPDDTEAAWQRLTASYQSQTGGRNSYDGFWEDMDTVTVTDVRATTPDQVQATVTYVQKSGNQKSTERRSFQLTTSGGVLKINQSAVL